MVRVLAKCCPVLVLLTLLSACGGGGGSGTNSPPPPVSDFSLHVTPPSVILTGPPQPLTVSVTGLGNFSGQVNISFNGLPSEIAVSPPNLVLGSGQQQQISLLASSTSIYGTFTLTVQASSGSLQHSAQVSGSVELAAAAVQHSPIRTRYIRTDSFYDPNSLQFAPPHFTVYDPLYKRFFVSNPYLNRIDVFDAAQEIHIGQITVARAWGLDISPDGKTLYAGTSIGDLYVVDPSAMIVTQRVSSSTIGPNGYSATQVFVLADGRLAMLGELAGQQSVDGSSSFAIWNPSDNSLDLHASNIRSGGTTYICPGNPGLFAIGPFAVSSDRTKVLLGSILSDGTLCSYDVTTKQTVVGSYGGFVRQIIPTPDGKRIFAIGSPGIGVGCVGVYDAATLTRSASLQGPDTDRTGPSELSLNGKTLYLSVVASGDALAAYDTTSLSYAGWVANYGVSDSQTGIVPAAADESGLIVGPIGHGVSFVDGALLHTGPPPPSGMLDFIAPGTGPVAGGTMLETTPLIGPVPTFSQFYVGETLLVNAVEVSPGPEGQPGPWITGRTPQSTTTGVADLTAIFQDGTISLSPEAFSYGPTIVEVAANASTSEGGTNGIIFGYGFGQSTSDVHVTVGGQSAQVNAIVGIPFQPFPIQFLAFAVPAGTAGATDDVTVTTPSGAATAPGSFHYTSSVEFHSSPTALQAGIFDPHRNVYYFTSPQQIAVLSKSTGAWLAPIPLPITKTSSQPLALSLSPDGSKLAASDYGIAAIYTLNPDNPATVKSYPVPQTGVGNALTTPSGLAITDTGIVYYATTYVGGQTGAITLHMLDTTTGATKDIGPFFDAGTVLTRVLLSPDGSRVYSNISGFPIWVDTTTGKLTISNSIIAPSGSVPDLAMSADGKTLTTNGALTDAYLNPDSLVAYTDREQFLPTIVVGQKLNQDGSLLFQPLAEGIDVIDHRTGRLLYRVEVPQVSAQVYDTLVVNPVDSTVAIITTNGVALIDLGLLPKP